jgi:anti-sigma factor RsiW
MCNERERLIGYIYDECEPAERRAVDAHLEQCTECRAEVQALRLVRADLLAWEVPGQPQVWRPFPEPVVRPWWRHVPAWAMTAAAGLVLAAGFAGGVAARALDVRQTPDVVMRAGPAEAPGMAGITPAQLSAAQEQIVSMMRAEFERRLARSQQQPVRAANEPVLRQVSAADAVDGEMLEALSQLYEDWLKDRNKTEQRFKLLQEQVNGLHYAFTNSVLGAGGGGLER